MSESGFTGYQFKKILKILKMSESGFTGLKD
jgi:hypothetical protein